MNHIEQALQAAMAAGDENAIKILQRALGASQGATTTRPAHGRMPAAQIPVEDPQGMGEQISSLMGIYDKPQDRSLPYGDYRQQQEQGLQDTGMLDPSFLAAGAIAKAPAMAAGTARGLAGSGMLQGVEAQGGGQFAQMAKNALQPQKLAMADGPKRPVDVIRRRLKEARDRGDLQAVRDLTRLLGDDAGTIGKDTLDAAAMQGEFVRANKGMDEAINSGDQIGFFQQQLARASAAENYGDVLKYSNILQRLGVRPPPAQAIDAVAEMPQNYAGMLARQSPQNNNMPPTPPPSFGRATAPDDYVRPQPSAPLGEPFRGVGPSPFRPVGPEPRSPFDERGFVSMDDAIRRGMPPRVSIEGAKPYNDLAGAESALAKAIKGNDVKGAIEAQTDIFNLNKAIKETEKKAKELTRKNDRRVKEAVAKRKREDAIKDEVKGMSKEDRLALGRAMRDANK